MEITYSVGPQHETNRPFSYNSPEQIFHVLIKKATLPIQKGALPYSKGYFPM